MGREGKKENKVKGGEEEKNYFPPDSVSIHVTFVKYVLHKNEFLTHDLRATGSITL
jgi:hypothetical protein